MERIVYVDKVGKPTGETEEKLAAHHANTRLHLAFSCYIFNTQNELLVTQRAHNKKVWPGVWTNSVCGHPSPGELVDDAISRRLDYELGMTLQDLQVILPTYQYQTPRFNGIIENEFCPVYVARTNQSPLLNADEVADYKWMKWDDFVAAAKNDVRNNWSWWCKNQLGQLENSQKFKDFLT